MDLELRGKNAIVTGGSGSLGGGCSEILAQEGCNIIIVHRHNTEERDAFAKRLMEEYGVDVKMYICDVSVHEEVEELFRKLDEDYDRLDILVNNACSCKTHKGIAETTYEEWQQAMDGVMLPVYLMSHEFIKRALERGHSASIVNVSAKSAEIAHTKNKIGYTVGKGGVNTLTKRIADDYCEKGIRVNSIVPGYIAGGFYHGTPEEMDAIAKEKGLRIGWATPKDLGNIVAFLASDKSKQIIGVNVDCSGGTML